jgi:Spy/CpxP family protein refolding chaperone
MSTQSKEIIMNRFILALAAVGTVTLSIAAFTAADRSLGTLTQAVAQTAPPPAGAPGPGGGHGNQRFAKMLMSLNLSDDQQNQIRGIMKAARDQNKSLTDVQAKRDNMRAAFTKVEAVLTPAQRTKLQAERDAARAQRAADAGHS